MPTFPRIVPCLWFDRQAEEAATFYTSVFPRSSIVQVARYGDAGQEIHGGKPGSVLTVAFELNGQLFTALNGGPAFRFNEALSLQVMCADQAEVDHYWTRLGQDGDPAARQCGWLKDRYGVSWQVIPSEVPEMLTDPDRQRADRVMAALLQMEKLDLAALRKAYAG